jgi:hypothetical protein
MKLTIWIKTKLEQWFGVAILRAEIASLRSEVAELSTQVDTTLKLQGENADSLEALDKLVKNSIASNSQMIREAEERMLMRLTALEEQSAGRNYTKPEADSSVGGHVRWSERKRQAEQAERLPDSVEKWTKPRTAQTQRQETT